MYAQALGNTFWCVGVVVVVGLGRMRRLHPESSLDRILFHACLSIFALSPQYIVEEALFRFSYLCFFLRYIRESSTAAFRRVGRAESLQRLVVPGHSCFYLSNIF